MFVLVNNRIVLVKLFTLDARWHNVWNWLAREVVNHIYRLHIKSCVATIYNKVWILYQIFFISVPHALYQIQGCKTQSYLIGKIGYIHPHELYGLQIRNCTNSSVRISLDWHFILHPFYWRCGTIRKLRICKSHIGHVVFSNRRVWFYLHMIFIIRIDGIHGIVSINIFFVRNIVISTVVIRKFDWIISFHAVVISVTLDDISLCG